MNILLGADPEVFVKMNDVFCSAHGLIQGDKARPFPVRDGAVQVDGMALEFNIDPAKNEEEFVHNIESVLGQLKAMVPTFRVVATPVAYFGKEYIDAQPDDAKELGCDPDFNAWTGQINEKPNADLPFRTGAGHIHIGWTEGEKGDERHIAVCHKIIKQLDFYLGLPSLSYDKEEDRRSMYGMAGAYRPKPYGVEYRVLSNAWVASPELMRWVYRTTRLAIDELMNGNILADTYGDIQHIINNNLHDEANAIINAAGLEVPNV